MKKGIFVLLLAVLALAFSSCQKEISFEAPIENPNNPDPGNPNPVNSLPGTYDFIDITAHGTNALTASQFGVTLRAVTYFDYVTKENRGEYVFTTDKVTGTAVHYAVDTVVRTEVSITGTAPTIEEDPFVSEIGPFDATGNYTLKGADSIVCDAAAFSIPELNAPGGTIPPTTTAKYSFSGDILTLVIPYKQTASEPYNGVTANISLDVLVTVRMKKK